MTDHMTNTMSPLVRELALRFSEPAWLQAKREAAWETYTQMPVPHVEKSDLSKRDWEVASLPAVPGAAHELLADLATDAPLVRIRDGVVQSLQIPDDLKQQGVLFCDLQTALQQHPELVQKYLASVIPATEEKWTALSSALWQNGLFLYVPKHLVVEVPLQFVYEQTADAPSAMVRNLIIAGEGATVRVTEAFLTVSARTAGMVDTHMTEVIAGATSRVTVASLNQFVKGPTHYVVKRAQVAKDAQVDWVFGDAGDGFTVATVESVMDGTGSRSTTRALGVGDGRQHLDLTASMVHVGRFSESNIAMTGVLFQRANSIYRSKTHIVRGAANASGEQVDRMLMLDQSARADAIPMLLIDENEVSRCGHAASVGRIDENQIYYLMSRGISKAMATRMIVWGYLEPVVEAIPSEVMQQVMVTLLERKLTK